VVERTSEGREEEKRKRDILGSVWKEKQKLGIYLSAQMQTRSRRSQREANEKLRKVSRSKRSCSG